VHKIHSSRGELKEPSTPDTSGSVVHDVRRKVPTVWVEEWRVGVLWCDPMMGEMRFIETTGNYHIVSSRSRRTRKL
jgi:hypothetical protein